MHRYLNVLMLGVALTFPAANGQDRDRQDRANSDQHSRRYEDKAHNDFHEWNDGEDQAYRRYLQERHKKYHDFATARKRDQNDYWNWRHSHPDSDRR